MGATIWTLCDAVHKAHIYTFNGDVVQIGNERGICHSTEDGQRKGMDSMQMEKVNA